MCKVGRYFIVKTMRARFLSGDIIPIRILCMYLNSSVLLVSTWWYISMLWYKNVDHLLQNKVSLAQNIYLFMQGKNSRYIYVSILYYTYISRSYYYYLLFFIWCRRSIEIQTAVYLLLVLSCEFDRHDVNEDNNTVSGQQV